MGVAIFLSIVGVFLFFLWAWSMARIAAPANEYERMRDDEDQIKFINEYMRERLNKTDPR